MSDHSCNGFFVHFSSLPDRRRQASVEHKFLDILFIAVCAVLCGANSFTDIHAFAINKADWLKLYCELPNGIPSHDTIRKVLCQISPAALETCFRSWVNGRIRLKSGEVIAFDGKAVRGSRAARKLLGALHIVSAWAVDNGLILGQVRVSDKSNEITAIPELLEALCIEGCVVTIDAMGCQTEIAKKIVEGKADYILSLKGNQENSEIAVIEEFEKFERSEHKGRFDQFETNDKGHDRTEIRRITVIEAPKDHEVLRRWEELKTLVKIESERTTKGKTSVEKRYYLSSLDCKAELHGVKIRSHWEIENKVHWILDVAFEEDACQIRDRIGAENMSTLRRIGVCVLSHDDKLKGGVESKRKQLGWNEKEVERILGLKPA